MSSLDPQVSYRPPSMLHRTVTSLPSVSSLTRLESLANDGGKEPPVQREARFGRTLEDMLRTPPHERSTDDIEEIEHVLTVWSKYGLDLPTPIRMELCTYMGFASFAPGDTIFKQGDYGEHFYIILSGAVDVLVKEANSAEEEEKTVAHLLAGAAFGELALMQGHGQRRATCRCSQNTELFTVDIKDFQRILRPLQQGSQQFKMSVLRQVPEFQGLPASVIESLAHVMTEKTFPPKAIIYYQGSEVEDLYIVQRGSVKMVRELRMDWKTRPFSSQSSSIPAWITDARIAHALSPRRATTSHGRTAVTKPPAGAKGGQASKARAAGGSRSKAPPPPPTYHKLSLDVIKSLTAEKPASRPGSRCAADSRGPLSGSKGKYHRQQRGATAPSGQHNSSANVVTASKSQTASQKSSADAAFANKSSVAGGSNSGSAGKAGDGIAVQPYLSPSRLQATFKFEQVKEVISEPAAISNNWLLSEATLTQRILQQMSYTGSHEADGRLFLEVDTFGKSEFFGEVAIMKSSTAPTTAVASNVTATLLVISKWDLLKRAPKELLDHISGRAHTSLIDDNAVREQYRECKLWQRYRQSVVNDVLQRRKAARSNNPVHIWKGPFRDEAPIDQDHRPWKL